MDDVAALFRALSEPVRLEMIWLLLNRRELCVCDFTEVLEITQSKASRHLRNLLHAGLVSVRREGLWSHYSLRIAPEDAAHAHLQTLFETLRVREEALDLLEKLDSWLAHAQRETIDCT